MKKVPHSNKNEIILVSYPTIVLTFIFFILLVIILSFQFYYSNYTFWHPLITGVFFLIFLFSFFFKRTTKLDISSNSLSIRNHTLFFDKTNQWNFESVHKMHVYKHIYSPLLLHFGSTFRKAILLKLELKEANKKVYIGRIEEPPLSVTSEKNYKCFLNLTSSKKLSMKHHYLFKPRHIYLESIKTYKNEEENSKYQVLDFKCLLEENKSYYRIVLLLIPWSIIVIASNLIFGLKYFEFNLFLIFGFFFTFFVSFFYAHKPSDRIKIKFSEKEIIFKNDNSENVVAYKNIRFVINQIQPTFVGYYNLSFLNFVTKNYSQIIFYLKSNEKPLVISFVHINDFTHIFHQLIKKGVVVIY